MRLGKSLLAGQFNRNNYYMVRLIIILPLILSILSVSAQNYSGIVLDAETNEPISYVNIVNTSRSFGTLSNSSGRFSIRVDPINNNDTILFYHLGYENLRVRISKLNLSNRNNTIRLLTKTYLLQEVIVKFKKTQHIFLGENKINKRKPLIVSWLNDKLGEETGTVIKNSKMISLEKLSIYIHECTYDTLYFRLNLYSLCGDIPKISTYDYKTKRKQPLSNTKHSIADFNKLNIHAILKEPIYVKLAKKEIVNNQIDINLSPYDLILDCNIFLTLEYIKDLGDGKLIFNANSIGQTFFRMSGSNFWTSFSAGISTRLEGELLKTVAK